MGLDMYLTGEKFLMTDWENPANKVMEDGYRVKERHLELGYWRKHPNLHGYIVKEFADGEDECQRIELNQDDIKKILLAVEAGMLPHTEGFFFGESPSRDDPDPELAAWAKEQYEETVRIFTGALAWLEAEQTEMGPKAYKSVVYQASW